MKTALAIMMAAAVLAARPAGAQNAPAPAAPPDTQAANVAGLGEIMTLQQLRHIKLWFAGRGGNWALADYEIDQLNDGFADVTKLLGGDIVEKVVGGPIKALQKAIASKDRMAFTAAFDNLSAGCNSCHRTLDHGFIAIQRPTLLPYSDQSFAPQR